MERRKEATGADLPRKRVRVGIAELAVGTDGAILSTSGLGSCVGIALYDSESQIGGLAHAMLPAAAESSGKPPEKFVDAGIERLEAALSEQGAAIDRVEARLVGGADMLDFDGADSGIGQRNVETARRVLAERTISIAAEAVGGDRGRSLAFYTDSGRVVVQSRDGRTEL